MHIVGRSSEGDVILSLGLCCQTKPVCFFFGGVVFPGEPVVACLATALILPLIFFLVFCVLRDTFFAGAGGSGL